MVSGKVFLGAVAAVAIFAGIGAGAAKADGWRGDGYGRGGYERGGDWGREEWRHHEWLEHHRYGYGYYAPPRVYYAPPPPIYYAPRPYYPGGFTVQIPIR
jgi:hypothetical protein